MDPGLPPHLIGRNRLGRYCVPLSSADRPVARAILDRRIWERRTLEAIFGFAGTGDVVHAGAYFGDFLPGVAAALAPGALLWAFEPVAENYACAVETVRLNGIGDRCRLHPFALGEAASEHTIAIAHPNGQPRGGGSYIVQHGVGDPTDVMAPARIIDLDAVVPIERQVSVIHLDVESYEPQALIGARRIVERWRPMLLLESLALPFFMRDVRYEVCDRVPGAWILAPA